MSDTDFQAALDASFESYAAFEAANLIHGCQKSESTLIAFAVEGGVYITGTAGGRSLGITVSRDDANRFAQQLIREAKAAQ